MAVALLHRVIGLSQSHIVITHDPQCLDVLTHASIHFKRKTGIPRACQEAALADTAYT